MRRVVPVVIALGLMFGLAAQVSAAGKKVKKNKTANGTIEAVDKDVLTVKIAAGKDQTAGPVEKKFKLTGDTKYQRVVKVKGQKGQKETEDAKFDDLQAGAKVTVQLQGNTAETVTIMGKAKKKKS